MNRYVLIDDEGHIRQSFAWDGESVLSIPPGWTHRAEAPNDTIYVEPTVPQSITPRQARLVLNASGLRDSVEAAVAASSRDVRDFWEYALEIERDNALLLELSAGLGITSGQLDALFAQAATL